MRHTVVRRTTLALSVLLVSSAGLFAWLVSPRGVEAPAESPPSPVEPAPVTAPTPSSVSPKSPAKVPSPASPPQTAPLPDGAALYRTYCGRCHSTSSLKLAEPRRDLEVFLRTHGDASDAEDRLILDFLAASR
jgi:hypothetical protein